MIRLFLVLIINQIGWFMKKIFLLSLFLLGCSKFSTIEPYTAANIALQIKTTQFSTLGQLPLTEGCYLESIQQPQDGGLILNQTTGEFNYVFQDLSLTVVNSDSFSFHQVCPQGTSGELWVLIDTSGIIY
jgi:hypothetical protein